MALEFTGIDNLEFYSAHYLDAVLEGDLKSVFTKWREAEETDGKPAPYKAVGRLAERYFRFREALVDVGGGAAERDERWHLARSFHVDLIDALGYPYEPTVESVGDGDVVPVLAAIERDGNPFLWILDCVPTVEADEDPLARPPRRVQLPPKHAEADLAASTWRELLDGRIFRRDDAPRWALFLTGAEAYLIERGKWPQGRYLRFRFAEIFGRKQTQVLRAVAGLLHRDVLAPDAGICVHDTLDESSHKHAYAVSGDLKHGVRRAVELLANEALWYRREVQHKGVFDAEEFSEEKLTSETLTWLYRLLFMFYVEARDAEVGIVPMGAEAYREGYSLESLRDLELVPLTSPQAQNGYFISDSLRKLFRIVNDGFPAAGEEGILQSTNPEDAYQNTMVIPALSSPLFDDERLEVLKGVKFRNSVLQEVLQLLSLSAEKKKKSRGRISYAQLGINQLGAVYEGLLSYTGFFATEDLHEVASEKDNKKLSGKPAAEREALKTYFVPASKIGEYREDEIVKDENGKKVVHKKGTFIFRLAGRNREKSASYYTPEVLTKCLVKYALKELLWEEGEEGEKPRRKKTADEILALTICEPAMGSSAFLMEAVDQLADAYLDTRQEEKGESIPPEDYQREKRRVKARLATNNCYGVDLNPTAVELAKVSLWLATLYEGGKCPWFGLRLATGNSLVGARREVFKTTDATRKGTKTNPNWLGLVPEAVSLYHGEDGPPLDEHWTAPSRPKGTIYHFLLPAEGMAAFDKDKVIKQLAPEPVKRIKEWRKEFCKPFNKKDAERLEQISDAVDRLFAQVVRERVLATQETSDRIPVWGEPPSAQQADLLVREQEEVAASLKDGSSAYRRLKLAMDAWCALWFWPIEEAGLLPDRATWLARMELILKGEVTHEEVWRQQGLFAELSPAAKGQLATSEIASEDTASSNEVSAERLKRLKGLSDAFRERRANYFGECGITDIEILLKGDASLRAAQRISDQQNFHHWNLRFAEVFSEKGGFDLVLGNPPWIKLRWEEGGLLSEFAPHLELRKASASEISSERLKHLAQPEPLALYLHEYGDTQGIQVFLNATQNYSLLGGMQSNLYKCFVTRASELGSPNGVIGFLHPEGVYDDPKGGRLREFLLPRLALHAQFINELILFQEIGHPNKFGINVYRQAPNTQIEAISISNLLHPRTLDESMHHDGHGPVPGIKTDEDRWELRGHKSRLIEIGQARLMLFASLYDEDGASWRESRLPVLHSEELVRNLEAIGGQQVKLGDLGERYYGTVMFDETYAQRDGVIRRDTQVAASLDEWILSGPHFYAATPLNKTPNEGCKSHGDYTSIDLTSIAADYLPRTNYVPGCSQAEYCSRVPNWNGARVTEAYRHVNRMFVNPTAEHTHAAAIIPPGPGLINTVYATCFESDELLLDFSSISMSLPADFLVKTSGKNHVVDDVLSKIPLPDLTDLRDLLWYRSLTLNCLLNSYSRLWEGSFRPAFLSDRLTGFDVRLGRFARPAPAWSRDSAARSDLDRRHLLLELDVLASMALGIERDGLLTMYRVQFPVLQQYERERLYDQHGRIVPTSKTASGNPAVSLVELAATLKDQAGFDVHAEYHPDASNTQDLRKQKIRLAKKEADVLGVPERCTMADLLAETDVRWSDEEHPEGRPVRLVGLRYTDPGLEPRMERVYPTPWTRCDREADYRQAWAEFERRLGKKMPEGTPLDTKPDTVEQETSP